MRAGRWVQGAGPSGTSGLHSSSLAGLPSCHSAHYKIAPIQK